MKETKELPPPPIPPRKIFTRVEDVKSPGTNLDTPILSSPIRRMHLSSEEEPQHLHKTKNKGDKETDIVSGQSQGVDGMPAAMHSEAASPAIPLKVSPASQDYSPLEFAKFSPFSEGVMSDMESIISISPIGQDVLITGSQTSQEESKLLVSADRLSLAIKKTAPVLAIAPAVSPQVVKVSSVSMDPQNDARPEIPKKSRLKEALKVVNEKSSGETETSKETNRKADHSHTPLRNVSVSINKYTPQSVDNSINPNLTVKALVPSNSKEITLATDVADNEQEDNNMVKNYPPTHTINPLIVIPEARPLNPADSNQLNGDSMPYHDARLEYGRFTRPMNPQIVARPVRAGNPQLAARPIRPMYPQMAMRPMMRQNNRPNPGENTYHHRHVAADRLIRPNGPRNTLASGPTRPMCATGGRPMRPAESIRQIHPAQQNISMNRNIRHVNRPMHPNNQGDPRPANRPMYPMNQGDLRPSNRPMTSTNYGDMRPSYFPMHPSNQGRPHHIHMNPSYQGGSPYHRPMNPQRAYSNPNMRPFNQNEPGFNSDQGGDPAILRRAGTPPTSDQQDGRHYQLAKSSINSERSPTDGASGSQLHLNPAVAIHNLSRNPSKASLQSHNSGISEKTTSSASGETDRPTFQTLRRSSAAGKGVQLIQLRSLAHNGTNPDEFYDYAK